MAYYPKEQYDDKMVMTANKSIGSAAAVEPMSALQERAKQLAHEFDQLEHIISSLWDRLRPFLTGSQPVIEDSVKGPREQHSPMWEELDNAVSRVAYNRVVMAQLLERVET